MAITLEPGNKYTVEVSDTGYIIPIEKIVSDQISLSEHDKDILEDCFRSYLSSLYQLNLNDVLDSDYLNSYKDLIIKLCEFYNIEMYLINDIFKFYEE